MRPRLRLPHPAACTHALLRLLRVPRRAPAALAALAALAGLACSKPSASASSGDEQGEKYARASASLAGHPRPATLPELAREIGTAPLGCALRDAVCECTWRFFTKQGARDIVIDAAFADARAFEPDTVLMIGRDGAPLDLPPDEAERGYAAGEYTAPKDGRVPVASPGGHVGTVPPEELTKALNGGGHLVSRRALKAAELEGEYATWPAPRRLDACLGQPAPVRQVTLEGTATAW